MATQAATGMVITQAGSLSEQRIPHHIPISRSVITRNCVSSMFNRGQKITWKLPIREICMKAIPLEIDAATSTDPQSSS